MKKSIKISFIFCLNLLFFSLIFAQEVNLFVKSSDIVIVDEKDSSQNVIGYHLYIKKSKNVESVMLTETTKDPLGKEPNYAYRAKEFNEIFIQSLLIMYIMGLFDRFFVDWYWVEHTKAWNIPNTEDLKPYIPKKPLLVKWTFTIVGFPIIAAMIAGIVNLIM